MSGIFATETLRAHRIALGHVTHIPRRVETHLGTHEAHVAQLVFTHVGLWVSSIVPFYPSWPAAPQTKASTTRSHCFFLLAHLPTFLSPHLPIYPTPNNSLRY